MTGAEVTEICSEILKVSVEDLRGNSRAHRISHPRFFVMLAIRRHGKTMDGRPYSYSRIGRYLGGRVNQPIMYGVQRAQQMIDETDEARELMERIDAAIESRHAWVFRSVRAAA